MSILTFVILQVCFGYFMLWFGKWIGRDEGYDRCWNEHHGIPND